MKNGNVQEFVDHIHYGDELWFLYNDTKYFLEGWIENDILLLILCLKQHVNASSAFYRQ